MPNGLLDKRADLGGETTKTPRHEEESSEVLIFLVSWCLRGSERLSVPTSPTRQRGSYVLERNAVALGGFGRNSLAGASGYCPFRWRTHRGKTSRKIPDNILTVTTQKACELIILGRWSASRRMVFSSRRLCALVPPCEIPLHGSVSPEGSLSQSLGGTEKATPPANRSQHLSIPNQPVTSKLHLTNDHC
jgi:hypothetical protein